MPSLLLPQAGFDAKPLPVSRREAERDKLEEFVHIVSHDLNAPLHSIINFSRLLAAAYGDRLDDNARRYADIIARSGRRLQEQLDALLHYSELHSAPLVLESVDCNHLAAECVKELRAVMRRPDAKVEIDPLPRVLADFDRLFDLFRRLIGNALKFGAAPQEDACIRISAALEKQEWRFTVSDRGPGIAPEQQALIFEVFYRIPGEEKGEENREEVQDDEGSGLGMGLAVARKIAEMHGGRLGVVSAPGEGATFHFTLPAHAENG